MHFELLDELVIIFLLSIVVNLVCNKIKLTATVGFLLTGVLCGPSLLGIVDSQSISDVAELGVAMLLFTGVSTIGMASGAGYRIAAVCAAVLCGLGGIVFAFYNEKKVLGVLET